MNRHLKIAFAAAGLMALAAGPALAEAAFATADVNVRSGPGVSFAKIGVLSEGTAVNVTECEDGFCFVEKPGTDGWVSQQYLAAGVEDLADPEDDDDTPDVHFGVNVGPGGPSFSFGIGDPPPAPAGEVCFYRNNNFAGPSFCAGEGEEDEQLIGGWNDQISSIRVLGGASVTVCRNWWYGGGCQTYHNNKPVLGGYNNKISSYQVF